MSTISELQAQIKALEAKLEHLVSSSKDSKDNKSTPYRNLKTIPRSWISDSKRNELLCEACRINNLEDVRDLLADGADPKCALNIACEFGRNEAVHLLIAAKGNDSWHVIYFNSGLNGAARGNHKDLVLRMMSEGAKDMNGALAEACAANQMPMVEFLISKGANDWDTGLMRAAANGHNSIVRLMLSKCGKDPEIINAAFTYACQSWQVTTVLLLMSLGANDWNEGLKRAYQGARGAVSVTGARMAIMALMLDRGATNADKVFKMPQDAKMVLDLSAKMKAPGITQGFPLVAAVKAAGAVPPITAAGSASAAAMNDS